MTTILIGTKSENDGSSTDTYGELYDANCNLIASDDDSVTDCNFNIMACVNSGIYYVKICHHNRTDGTGKYIMDTDFLAGMCQPVPPPFS